MATYAVLGLNNAVQQVPIQTWGDTFYVLFGKARRDLVNSVDQAIVNVARPEFDQKKAEPLKNDVTLVEALYDRYMLLKPDLERAEDFLFEVRLETPPYWYQWDAWSQLIEPQFLMKVLAHTIYTVALMVWDLVDGISEKIVRIGSFYDAIWSSMEVEVMKIEKDDNVILSGSVSPLEYLQSMVGIKIHFKNGVDPRLPISDFTIKIERSEEWDNDEYFEREMPQEGLNNSSLLTKPTLVVTFDSNFSQKNDIITHRLQCMAAVELMMREDSNLLIVRTPHDVDLSLWGFDKADDWSLADEDEEIDDFVIWRLTKVHIVGALARQIKMPDGLEKTWAEIINKNRTFFNQLPPQTPLFPEQLFLSSQEPEVVEIE